MTRKVSRKVSKKAINGVTLDEIREVYYEFGVDPQDVNPPSVQHLINQLMRVLVATRKVLAERRR